MVLYGLSNVNNSYKTFQFLNKNLVDYTTSIKIIVKNYGSYKMMHAYKQIFN